MGDFDATIEHHLLDISEAERKSIVKPNAIGNDLGRESMSFVAYASSNQLIDTS